MKKIYKWYSSLGITIKYITIVVIIVIPFAIGAIYTSSKNDDMDSYGISFNIVQVERMRTYLISDYVQQLYTGEAEGDTAQVYNARSTLNAEIPIYEEHIDYLMNRYTLFQFSFHISCLAFEYFA